MQKHPKLFGRGEMSNFCVNHEFCRGDFLRSIPERDKVALLISKLILFFQRYYQQEQVDYLFPCAVLILPFPL